MQAPTAASFLHRIEERELDSLLVDFRQLMLRCIGSGTRALQQEFQFHRTTVSCGIIQPKLDASARSRCQLCGSKCATAKIANPSSRACWFQCTSCEAAERGAFRQSQEAADDSEGEESAICMFIRFVVFMGISEVHRSGCRYGSRS
jgi:hypothetical protein